MQNSLALLLGQLATDAKFVSSSLDDVWDYFRPKRSLAAVEKAIAAKLQEKDGNGGEEEANIEGSASGEEGADDIGVEDEQPHMQADDADEDEDFGGEKAPPTTIVNVFTHPTYDWPGPNPLQRFYFVRTLTAVAGEGDDDQQLPTLVAREQKSRAPVVIKVFKQFLL